MNPHPRIRKTIKWGGAAVTVLLVVVWIGSGWWFVSWCRPNTGFTGPWVGLSRGEIWFFRRDFAFGGDAAIPEGWEFHVITPAFDEVEVTLAKRFRLFPSARWSDDNRVSVRLPLWIPSLIACWTSAWAWRLDTLARRRARAGLCPKCTYDRAGLASDAVCPECGSAGGPA